ncbi:MAG: FAD-dependent oxidoreductase [Thermodesulfovibrionales bacterium]
MAEENLYDVVIIGGGPAGLSAAIYAVRAGMKVIVLDKSSTAGALAFADRIENYPGLTEPLSGAQLLEIFRKQAVGLGAVYRKDAQVVGVRLEGDEKEVFTMEETFRTKAIIVATGAMGRKASIKGEAEFLGRGVSYCAICDAPFFRGKTVCVIGDSEEAVKEAGVLSRFAETVYLVSPSKKLKAHDHPALESPNVKVLLDRRVTAIEGGDTVERIRMADSSDGEESLELSGVFVYLHGNKPIVDFLGNAVEMSEEECVSVNKMMETSIPGVFAAGDVACTEVRQVVIAAANGCVAALSAEKYVFRRARRRFDWAKKPKDAKEA